MQNKHFITLMFFSSLILLGSCNTYQAKSYLYPDPVDTNDKEIDIQFKKLYSMDGVYADNRFDGARLNDFLQVDENTFRAQILPENHPINKSPWFSFKLWSDKKRKIYLILDYTHSAHRYIPKISRDKMHWKAIDTNSIRFIDSLDVGFPLELGPEPIYLSAQELITSENVYQWCDSLTLSQNVQSGVYGKSVMQRDLPYMDIYENEKSDKALIVILSRQHPPEISGWLAMRHFVEAILDTNLLSEAYRNKFRTLVFPLVNPDGVDMGHWRHNANGIDLNRDWGFYVQPEIRQTVDFIVREQKMNDNEVILGIDFHSTQEDIFYTYADTMLSEIPKFKDYWIYGIDQAMPDYEPVDEPSGLSQPYSKVWFYTQFEAEGITYEIGDETPRDFIKRKARISAEEMMKLLMYYEDD